MFFRKINNENIIDYCKFPFVKLQIDKCLAWTKVVKKGIFDKNNGPSGPFIENVKLRHLCKCLISS